MGQSHAELKKYLIEVQGKIKEREIFETQKRVALKHAYENMEEQRVEWDLHRKNMRFMKSDEPSHVDMKEYVICKGLLAAEKEKYDEFATKARNLTMTLQRYREQNAADEAEIERVEKILNRMGDLIELFPGKTEA